MAKKARLAKKDGAIVPQTDGWFVINAADAAWYGNEKFGATAPFEGKARFPQYGINIHVVWPGQPNCHYHAESDQEDFLVLSGRCKLLVEGKAIPLRAWDFVHCSSMTEHVFVGAGKGPCAILMVGARSKQYRLRYPRSALALRHGAGVANATSDAEKSYAGCPLWKPLRSPWKAVTRGGRVRRPGSPR